MGSMRRKKKKGDDMKGMGHLPGHMMHKRGKKKKMALGKGKGSLMKGEY